MMTSMNESLANGTGMERLEISEPPGKLNYSFLITTLQDLEAIPLGTMFSKHFYC